VKQQQALLSVLVGQAAKPVDPFVSDQLACGRRVVLEQYAQKVAQLRGLSLLDGALLGPPEHLIGISEDALPAELTYEVYYLCWLAAGEREIATLENTVYMSALDIRDHRLERGQVAVDV
jgi:hypothetical protein